MLYKDLRILYSHEKRKLSNGQLWTIWKGTAFIELYSFFIDLLAFEQGKLCPGVGTFVSFFRPGVRSFALKSCPGGGDFDRKKSGPGPSPEGIVTGQIDTCISFGGFRIKTQHRLIALTHWFEKVFNFMPRLSMVSF